MSTDSPGEIIQTATMAIFTPEMDEVMLTVNSVVDGVVLLGGKFDPQKDRDIYETGLRESREEGGIIPFWGSGVFLDSYGKPINEQVIIQTNPFYFPKGQRGNDTLFYFRLYQKPDFHLPSGAFFVDRKKYQRDRVEKDNQMYTVRALDVRERVLAIMK